MPWQTVLAVLGMLVALAALGWIALAFFALARGGRALAVSPRETPETAVSLLVPLHGPFRGLDECLEGFFRQDHPCFEIVFGSVRPDDPAFDAVEAVRRRHPGVEARTVVTSPAPPGTNPKIANLEGIAAASRHPVLVLIDADILVSPDHLRRVTAPLSDPATGLVTCPYGAAGFRKNRLRELLAALYIGDWFYTSVLAGSLLAPGAHGFGATLALRRETLEASGGWPPLRAVLADDNVLAARVRALGLRTGIVEAGVRTVVDVSGWRDLWTHEVRWLGTIRALDPAGYGGLPVTLTTVPALLALVLLGFTTVGGVSFAVLLAGRLVLHFRAWDRSRSESIGPAVLLLPLRDLLTFAEWLTALVSRKLEWKDAVLAIDSRGNLEDSEP